MNRRPVGLLALVGALFVLAVAPGIFTAPVSGVAERGPIPAMPAVGDCLLAPVGPAVQNADGALTYPPVRTGPCSGHRFGEVVAVVASPKVQSQIVSPVDGSVPDPTSTACDDDVEKFLGTDAAVDTAQRSGVTWIVLPAAVRSLRIGPSVLQKSFGQHWIACVGYLDPDSDARAVSGDYLRSARGSFSGGTPPAAFSTCVAVVKGASMTTGDCYLPHQAELIGLAFGSAAASGRLLTSTCRALASRYTGLTDPTAGGRLTVSVIGELAGEPVPDGVVDISSSGATCLIRPTAGHLLTGPLMSLGARPVPLL